MAALATLALAPAAFAAQESSPSRKAQWTHPTSTAPLSLHEAPLAPASVSARLATTYADPFGDATGGAPDVTATRVTNDASGNITFSASVSGMPAPEAYVDLWIDSDRNGATGDEGVEYNVFFDGSDNRMYAERWNGSAWVEWSPASGRAGYQNGVWTVILNRSDLGGTSALDFYFIASKFAGQQELGRDDAPDGTAVYTYTVTQAPPPPNPPPGTPPNPPRTKTFEDAPRLPSRIRYIGQSIKHVRLGEKLYSTMKRLGAPRVVAVACWSRSDWSSVLDSATFQANDRIDGFWLGQQPRWVHLSPKQCTDVQGLMSDRQANGQRAYALSTVLHERIHAQGIRIEAQAECFANQLVYDFARELNFVHTKAIRLEQLAVRKSNAQFTGTIYRNSAKCRDGGAWDLYPEFRNLDY